MSERTTNSPVGERELREALATVYTPEGVELWLTGAHKRLEGQRAIDVFQTDPERIWQLVEQLQTGAII